MANRGRPCKNGKVSPWVLRRETFAIYAYDDAWKAGEKHDAALQDAASYVQKMMPGIACSKTEVRRILAVWRPQNSAYGITVSKPDPNNKALTLGLPGVRGILLASWGPLPDHPRHNAANKPPKKTH